METNEQSGRLARGWGVFLLCAHQDFTEVLPGLRDTKQGREGGRTHRRETVGVGRKEWVWSPCIISLVAHSSIAGGHPESSWWGCEMWTGDRGVHLRTPSADTMAQLCQGVDGCPSAIRYTCGKAGPHGWPGSLRFGTAGGSSRVSKERRKSGLRGQMVLKPEDLGLAGT